MIIEERWGSEVWADPKTADLIALKMSEHEGGELERMHHKIETLKNIVGGLIDRAGLTDQQKLDLLDLWNWQVKEAA